MKNILILTIVAIILLIVVIIICLRFQKGNSELLNAKNKDNGTQKECNSCRQMINSRAKVCQYCGRSQSLLGKLGQTIPIIVSIVMTLTSIALVILAGIQLKQARQKNIDASEALATAEEAVSKADKLKGLLEKSTKLTSEIVEIQRKSILINEFMMTVINAQNGYRKALDQLHKWSNDDSFLLNHQAWQAWKDIAKKYNPYLNNKIGTPLPWKEGTDPSTLTFIDLKRIYQGQDSLSDYKPALINYIWMRNDISEGERMEFLVEIIKSDDSLKAVNVAGQLFWKAAKLKSRIFSSEEDLSKWWEENKGNYNKNPEDQPTDSPDKK